MHLKHKFSLKLPASLALPHISKKDIALVVLGHLTLLFTWAMFLIHFPTIIGIALAFIIFFILKITGAHAIKPAAKLLLSRIIISLAATLTYGIYGHFHTVNIEGYTPHTAWYLLSYILGTLAAYDLYWISKGFKGLSFIETK